MLLKLLTSRVGDNFSQIRGDEIEVDCKEGCSMVDAQQAVPHGAEAKAEYEAYKKQKSALAAKPKPQAKPQPTPNANQEEGGNTSPTVDELGLKTQYAKALREAGITTLEEVHGADLASIKGLGEKSAAEIREQLAAYLSR